MATSAAGGKRDQGPGCGRRDNTSCPDPEWMPACVSSAGFGLWIFGHRPAGQEVIGCPPPCQGQDQPHGQAAGDKREPP